jgi:hypothetical protein
MPSLSSFLTGRYCLCSFIAALTYISIVSRYNHLVFISQNKLNEFESNGKLNNHSVSDTKNKLNNSAKNKSSGKLRLAHVVNFFPCAPNCDNLFTPVDQAQNVTFASMTRAMESTTKADVAVYAAMFPGDEYIVPPNFVILSKRLQRSTMTEYPKLPKRKLPFLDDIISSLYDSVNTEMFDYVVYTNADIGLQKSFYNQIATIINHGYDGFSINRQTLNRTFNGKELSGNDLDLIYNMTGTAHRGTDCIIFKKDLYRNNFTLGDVFLGRDEPYE